MPMRDKLISRLAAKEPSGARRWALVLAAGAFFVVAFVGLMTLPPLPGHIRWVGLVLATVAGAPASLLANAYEFRLTGLATGQRISMAAAARVSVVASAANLVPLPGGLIVRARDLQRRGTPPRRAVEATILVGFIWVATSLLAAGVIGAITGNAGVWATGGALLAAVAIVVVAGWIVQGRGSVPSVPWTAKVVVVETASVGANALRYVLVIWGLGGGVRVAPAAYLALAATLASAAGIFPAGLGLREALAGLLGPLAGLDASTAVTVAAVDRLLGALAIGVLAIAVLPRWPAEAKRTLA